MIRHLQCLLFVFLFLRNLPFGEYTREASFYQSFNWQNTKFILHLNVDNLRNQRLEKNKFNVRKVGSLKKQEIPLTFTRVKNENQLVEEKKNLRKSSSDISFDKARNAFSRLHEENLKSTGWEKLTEGQ